MESLFPKCRNMPVLRASAEWPLAGRHALLQGLGDRGHRRGTDLISNRLHRCVAAIVIACGVTFGSAQAGERWAVPAHGVIGVDDDQLTPEYWIARAADADRVIF